MTDPLRLLRPSEDDLAFARAILKIPTATRPQMIEACTTLAQSPEWMDRCLASEMRNVLWSDRASELLPPARELAERLARNASLIDPRAYPPLTDEELDSLPRYAGLQQGEVVGRWIERQAPVDRALFWAVICATVLIGMMSLGLLLLGAV